MADWTAEVFENEYLPADATDVHAIVTVGCTGAGTAGQSAAAAEVIIVDTSGSMSSPRSKIISARKAAAGAVDELVDGTWFAVIAGDNAAEVVYPAFQGMVQAGATTRAEAQEAVEHLEPIGGTAIGSWLAAATDAVRHRRGGSAPRDPAHRRTRRVGERGRSSQAASSRPAASSSATAAGSAPTGR